MHDELESEYFENNHLKHSQFQFFVPIHIDPLSVAVFMIRLMRIFLACYELSQVSYRYHSVISVTNMVIALPTVYTVCVL